ncbi:MAG: HU family DNA-binding protein [Balneolales bacterium]
MDKDFTKAMVDELKNQLIEGYTVSIKGLGSFALIHVKQSQKQDSAGRVMLLPPEDRIRFTPES